MPEREQERVERLAAELAQAGQGHLLAFFPRLGADERRRLLGQLEALDLRRLAGLIASVRDAGRAAVHQFAPPELIDVADRQADSTRRARERGEALLAEGGAAAFLVAGGQGTRLGFDGPKGRFGVGPLTRRSLFAYHAQKVLATRRRYGCSTPLLVMTSPGNHADTQAAFAEARGFGLPPEDLWFLVQGTLPAIDREGRILLTSPHELALGPDGHGGCFGALQRSGALDRLRARGVTTLFSFQVDNPLAAVLDPVFLGHHALAGADMSTKVVEKLDPAEKVGVLAHAGGRPCVVEYSDLSDADAHAREADGRLRFRAGNIAIHAIELDFAERVLSDADGLPVHRALKKVPCIDAQGRQVDPREPNAIKLELFVFDALRLARRVANQLVRREEEFAPVKNKDGPDSPETARAALVAQGKRWMAAAGLHLPAGPVEVGPLFALDQDSFAANLTQADFGPVFDRP